MFYASFGVDLNLTYPHWQQKLSPTAGESGKLEQGWGLGQLFPDELKSLIILRSAHSHTVNSIQSSLYRGLNIFSGL